MNWPPRQESNLELQVRNPLFYPLNYEGCHAGILLHPAFGITVWDKCGINRYTAMIPMRNAPPNWQASADEGVAYTAHIRRNTAL